MFAERGQAAGESRLDRTQGNLKNRRYLRKRQLLLEMQGENRAAGRCQRIRAEQALQRLGAGRSRGYGEFFERDRLLVRHIRPELLFLQMPEGFAAGDAIYPGPRQSGVCKDPNFLQTSIRTFWSTSSASSSPTRLRT